MRIICLYKGRATRPQGEQMEVNLTPSQKVAVHQVAVERLGPFYTQDCIEFVPSGKSVFVTLRCRGVDISGEPAMLFDSEWLIGPNGKTKRWHR